MPAVPAGSSPPPGLATAVADRRRAVRQRAQIIAEYEQQLIDAEVREVPHSDPRLER